MAKKDRLAAFEARAGGANRRAARRPQRSAPALMAAAIAPIKLEIPNVEQNLFRSTRSVLTLRRGDGEGSIGYNVRCVAGPVSVGWAE